MKRFPRIGMRPIRSAISAWRDQACAEGPLTLVMTYPHYLFLRDLVRPDVQVYFNLDDYAHYWPRRAEEIGELERRAVRESDLTVCVSARRAEQLRRAVPTASARVRHLPHGTPEAFRAPYPMHLPGPAPDDLAAFPRPYFGYVGSLEDRIDWKLLERVADSFPSGTIALVGRPKLASGAAWSADARRCLRKANVRVLGWKPQAELGSYVGSFDACLIPYRADHPFNIACCPTKIMDYMGSGRPIVSTALPECRLYPGLLHLADDHEVFLEALDYIVRSGSDDGRAAVRHAWATEHTCSRMAQTFLDWLPG
jgi:glycosyltransferase involved in cell wall biosynthesis